MRSSCVTCICVTLRWKLVVNVWTLQILRAGFYGRTSRKNGRKNRPYLTRDSISIRKTCQNASPSQSSFDGNFFWSQKITKTQSHFKYVTNSVVIYSLDLYLFREEETQQITSLYDWPLQKLHVISNMSSQTWLSRPLIALETWFPARIQSVVR